MHRHDEVPVECLPLGLPSAGALAPEVAQQFRLAGRKRCRAEPGSTTLPTMSRRAVPASSPRSGRASRGDGVPLVVAARVPYREESRPGGRDPRRRSDGYRQIGPGHMRERYLRHVTCGRPAYLASSIRMTLRQPESQSSEVGHEPRSAPHQIFSHPPCAVARRWASGARSTRYLYQPPFGPRRSARSRTRLPIRQ